MSCCVSACLLVLGVVIFPPRAAVRAEVFTALVHMEGLVTLEKELLTGLDSYLDMERKRFDTCILYCIFLKACSVLVRAVRLLTFDTYYSGHKIVTCLVTFQITMYTYLIVLHVTSPFLQAGSY